MQDLVSRVKAIKNWDERKLSTVGSEDLTIYNAEAVAHADTCLGCKVPGGCDDTHNLCGLRIEHGVRAGGEIRKVKFIHAGQASLF